MVIKAFVEAIDEPTEFRPKGADRIPGTDKVRTYVANGSLYSRQSSLENILGKNTNLKK